MSDPAVRPLSDEEWKGLMRQLRAQPQVRPRPFFYARVHARLTADASATSPPLPAWLRRPAYAALLAALVMTLSGDGAALRSAAGVKHADISPSGQPLWPLQR